MENVGGPYMRNYHSAKAAAMIEPGIEPLTDDLNAVGVPLSSCEGHANKGPGEAFQWLTGLLPIDAYKPFVMFGASEEYARSFQRHYDRTTGFHYCWTIKGHFHPQGYDLVWTIEPIDYCLARGEVDAEKVSQDIRLLASVAVLAAKAI